MIIKLTNKSRGKERKNRYAKLSQRFTARGKEQQERQTKKYMQKKYNRFKNIKIIKKRKKKEEREKDKKENSTEPQRPNMEAEVYNNNKKCDRMYIYTYIPISKI